MQWIELIINIILSVLSGLIYSAVIFAVLYLAYKVEVKNYSFDLHFRILEMIKSRMENKSVENRVNTFMDKYHTLIEKPSFINIIIPVSIVCIIGFLLYNQLIFFAVIGSGSMAPTFEKSDLILMQNVDVEVNVGDIIMFETPTVLNSVTHRVVGISENGIITKGDAKQRKDDWVVKNDQILAKAVAWNDKPIIIKKVGVYFIEEFESGIVTQKFNEEFVLMRKIITAIKSLGLVIFFFAIFMYILSSIRS